MNIRNSSRPVLGVVALLCALTIANSANALGSDDNMATRQLGRGVANFLGGITEIPVTVHSVTQQEGDFAGLTVGTLKGVGRFLTREVVGIFEVFTFPLGMEPIIEPEFPMQGDTLNRWHVRDVTNK